LRPRINEDIVIANDINQPIKAYYPKEKQQMQPNLTVKNERGEGGPPWGSVQNLDLAFLYLHLGFRVRGNRGGHNAPRKGEKEGREEEGGRGAA
jgi:hypothetical protein